MKISIYELLGLVKDGKAPKKIKYDGRLYEFNDKKDNYYENETCSINWDYVSLHCLNEKVEILEEEKKIPEKLKWNEKSQHNIVTDNTKKTLEHLLSRSEQLKKSVNQIVDYLEHLKSKGE